MVASIVPCGSSMGFTPASCARLLPGGMRDEQNWLLAVIHFAVGQAWRVDDDQMNVILAGTSAAVTTANSLQSALQSKAIQRMVPRGTVLRTVAPYHMPSRSKSST
jgi:hypothetical protein